MVLFALSRSVWTTLAAVVLNFLVYQLFTHVAFLDVTMPPNPWSDVLVTASVAGPISFLAYYFLGRAIMALAISRDSFERLSRTDPLTGLLNRRAFAEAIAAFEAPYILAVIDIDRFKAINDTYGHGAGDVVLVEVARELREVLGRDTAVARLGGEEFGVILRDRNKAEAVAAMDLVRAALASRTFDAEGASISVTFSAGVARGDGKTGYSIWLTHADKALYFAKAAGRNRVVHSDDILAVVSGTDNPVGKIAV